MRRHAHLWFALTTLLSVLVIVQHVIGQNNFSISIYRSPESITVYIPGGQPVNIAGLQFEVTTSAGTTIVRTLNEFPSFRGLPFENLSTPICFRIVRTGVAEPVPLDCQTVTTLTQVLAAGDVFWYDAAGQGDRVILVYLRDFQGICPSGQPSCSIEYQPSVIPTATVPGLIVVPDVPATLDAFASISRNEDWTPFTQSFDGVEMVFVPMGCFMMGTTEQEVEALAPQGENPYLDEMPQHEVCFERPFWIDRTEVTNLQFAAFGGRAQEPGWWSEPNLPRETITLIEARDFCEHKRPGNGRLPTEAEWEYAARGPSNWVYPWSGSFNEANVIYGRNSGKRSVYVGTRETGASWVGALDLSGNVWEFIGSIYEPYDSETYDPHAYEWAAPADDVNYVMRGGSYYYDGINILRTANRGFILPRERRNSVGLRCVRDYIDGDLAR